MARILPSIITVMLVGWQLVPRLRGEGPFWSTDAARFVGECDTQWLQTVLLSNNLSTRTRTHNMCLGHTWSAPCPSLPSPTLVSVGTLVQHQSVRHTVACSVNVSYPLPL